MEGGFQYQGQLDQYLGDWLYPRGIKLHHGFFSKEDTQESIRIEYLDPYGAIISNQAPEGKISTMSVFKWSYKVEGSEDNIDAPLCGRLYKEEKNSLVTLSGTDPDAKMNCFTWSRGDNDWIVPGINTMDNSRTGKELSIMVNSACRP